MDSLILSFDMIDKEQMYSVEGGCGFCKASVVVGTAATGVGVGGAVGSVPGAIIGGVVGTGLGILTIM